MQVDVLKRQTEAMIPVFGKALGFELYREDKYGEFLVRLQYIERLEKHPVVWRFWMYKPGATWQVNQITFNDQLTFD